MDPRLTKIEALTEAGCYTVTVTLGSGEERSVVARVRDDEVALPAAAVDGWSAESASYPATLAAVQAVHAARELAGPQDRRLSDVAGGWDVSLGNVVLDPDGRPSCVTHGELAAEPGERYRCAECGAVAEYC
ncbi:MAG TPA: hypothetical protein VFU36_13260 [Jatrophihabitans sp.]|nr:hypothetical protein [Jatrophihabitans sp.]